MLEEVERFEYHSMLDGYTGSLGGRTEPHCQEQPGLVMVVGVWVILTATVVGGCMTTVGGAVLWVEMVVCGTPPPPPEDSAVQNNPPLGLLLHHRVGFLTVYKEEGMFAVSSPLQEVQHPPSSSCHPPPPSSPLHH